MTVRNMLLNRESLRYCNYRGDFCIYSAVGLFQMNKLIAAILVSLLSFPCFSKGKEDWLVLWRWLVCRAGAEDGIMVGYKCMEQ